MNKAFTWTGERLETFIMNEVMLEHLHRYAIAGEFTKDKKVLDIACGEGYGVNLLSADAAHVTGMDIDKITIEKAKNKYKAGNIIFKTGTILEIPAENNSFDVITCFETLEHTGNHDKALDELKRVLAPSGFLFISTPEKSHYSDAPGYKNPFHEKELYGDEFKDLLRRYFRFTGFYEQSSFTGSLLINNNQQAIRRFFTGDYEHIQAGDSTKNMYWLAIASDIEVPELSSSLFQDRKLVARVLNEQEEAFKKTMTYRTGRFILAPIRFIRFLFRK